MKIKKEDGFKRKAMKENVKIITSKRGKKKKEKKRKIELEKNKTQAKKKQIKKRKN